MPFPIKIERKKFNLDNNGYSLFLFPSDPSLFWISPIVEEILDLAETRDKESIIKSLGKRYDNGVINRAFQEIERVEERGFFKSGSRNLWKKIQFPKSIKDMHMRSLNLHTTHDCNLDCNYCYADKGSFGLEIPERFMDWAVAKKAIDWFFVTNKNSDFPLNICFIGGEPLLNITVIEKALQYIEKEKKPKYPNNILITTMTNGVLLKKQKVAKVLAKYYVKPTISIDASQKDHNKNRPYKNGRPSYDDIILGIKKLKSLAPDLPIMVRSVIDLDNNLKDFFYKKESLGISGAEFSIKYSLFSTQRTINSLLKRMEEEFLVYNKDVILGKKRPIFATSMLLQFFHGNQVASETCGAGLERISVIPNGEIHICSGVKLDYKTTYLGDVYNGVDGERLRDIYKMHASRAGEYRNHYCSNCWARNFCVGICVLSKAKPDAKDGNSRLCDYRRMIIGFSIKSYVFMGSGDLFEWARYNTGDRREKKGALSISEKIKLLHNIREIYNKDFKYLKQITPTAPN
jgi:uncharacterized protein